MKVFKTGERFTLYKGDCRKIMSGLNDNSIDLVITDPPYFLSNNGISCN